MKVDIHTSAGIARIDLSQGTDLSLPLTDGQSLSAWQQPPPQIKAVCQGDWVGKVKSGASVNFNHFHFNPHAHLTHTEGLGHITRDFYSVNQIPDMYKYFRAALVSIAPQPTLEGRCIGREQLKKVMPHPTPEALVIRTLPNLSQKKSADYSGSNPPFLSPEGASWLAELDIKHLLIDLPSVDPEKDEGKLLAHKAFWQVEDVCNPGNSARYEATITELIYVPDTLTDGFYYLHLELMPVENDAAPSRPILFKEI